MPKIHHTIKINAPVEKVWNTMFDHATYTEWTKPFSENSTFKGSWEEGSEIQFVDPSGMGMHSRIQENRLHEFVSIEHLGIVKDGIVDTESEEAKKWAPAFENYTFTQVEGGVEVAVDMDIRDEYKDQFDQMWPAALQALKEISEK